MFDYLESAAQLDRGARNLVADFMAVKPGESVLITSDTATDAVAVQAIFRAVQAAGATPSVLTFSQLPYQGALADPYLPSTVSPAVRSCDVWIDMTFPYMAGSHGHEAAIADKRVRYLLFGDLGSGGMSRLFGGINLDEYFFVANKLQELVDGSIGMTMRITDPLGTDVSFTVDKPGFSKARRAEKPGMYFVPGAVTIFPVLESVRGTIALAAVFHEYFSLLTEPIFLKVDGKIREVRGPAHHRIVLDRALRRAGNGEYGSIIHFTHSMNPAARMTGKSFIEDLRVMGNDAVGMGLPFWVPGGGENHPDGVIMNQSIWLEGQQIVRDSVIVGPRSVAEHAHLLVPAVQSAHRAEQVSHVR